MRKFYTGQLVELRVAARVWREGEILTVMMVVGVFMLMSVGGVVLARVDIAHCFGYSGLRIFDY